MSAAMYTKSGFNTCFFYLHGYSMSLPALAKESLSLAAITSLLRSAICCKYNINSGAGRNDIKSALRKSGVKSNPAANK